MPLLASVLAASSFHGLFLLLIAVLGFAMVAVVAVVVLALIHAVLPSAEAGGEIPEPAEDSEDNPSTCDSA